MAKMVFRPYYPKKPGNSKGRTRPFHKHSVAPLVATKNTSKPPKFTPPHHAQAMGRMHRRKPSKPPTATKKPPPAAIPLVTTIFRGDVPANIRVTKGSVIVEGNLNGDITGVQKGIPLDPGDIELKPGEELIVKGNVFGDIEAEDSNIYVMGDVFGIAGCATQNVKIKVDGNAHGPTQPKQSGGTASDNECTPEKQPQPRGDGRGVEIVTLLSFPNIQKSYGDYLIVYERSFRKLIKGERDSVKPTQEEVEQFKYDVSEAAKSNPEVAKFLAVNPELKTHDSASKPLDNSVLLPHAPALARLRRKGSLFNGSSGTGMTANGLRTKYLIKKKILDSLRLTEEEREKLEKLLDNDIDNASR